MGKRQAANVKLRTSSRKRNPVNFVKIRRAQTAKPSLFFLKK